jgi:hypothetical protein
MTNQEIQKLSRNERFFYKKFARMPNEAEIQLIDGIGWLNFLEIHNRGLSGYNAGKKAAEALNELNVSLKNLSQNKQFEHRSKYHK